MLNYNPIVNAELRESTRKDKYLENLYRKRLNRNNPLLPFQMKTMQKGLLSPMMGNVEN
jgi:hypothetical protein